ncbi:MAG: DUF192 domain-containing protein [Bdellovibrionota bacterium]
MHRIFALALGLGLSSPLHAQLRDDQLIRLGAGTCDEGPVYHAQLADTPEERAQGLGGTEPLAADEAMLFVFGDAAPRSFWMKNLSYPLSIFFFDADGKLLSSQEMAVEADPSNPVHHYLEPGNAAYAVEAKAGESVRLASFSVRLCL